MALSIGVVAADAPSLTGKWTGTIDVHDSGSGSTISTPVAATFTQSASGITGKIAREGDADEAAVTNAKLEGEKFYFEAGSGETAGSMKFNLKLSENHIEGEMKGAIDNQDIVGQVKLDRAK